MSSNNLAWGTNDRVTPKRAEKMAAKFTLPLLDLDAIIDNEIDTSDGDFFKRLYPNRRLNLSSIMPPVRQLAVFSVYGKLVDEISDLKRGVSPSSFDKCTMIITVYDRHKTIRDRLKFYQWLEVLESIVVVWNNLQVPLPDLPSYKIPVYIIKQKANSLNNRFYPWVSCVSNTLSTARNKD